jgi:thiol:disulfide interchange protein DsbD
LIADAIAREPVTLPAGYAVHISSTRDRLILAIDSGKPEQAASFFPFDEFALRNAAEQRVTSLADGIQLELERADASDQLPARLRGVVEFNDGRAFAIDAPVFAASAASTRTSSEDIGFAGAILLAFVGGSILNLMPCVFPVLFLKALSLTASTGEEPRARMRHGLAYTVGILASFWAILGALLILRAGGHQLGWGFQLQSPAFVAGMASLLFFMALSMAGQFDLGLSFTGKGDSLTRKSGFAGSFFTGMPATVVATPCTAPLMGAAIGFALSQSVLSAFSIFTSLAMGLALPYLLFTLQPLWAKRIPRPGRWMELLKQFTSVPLFLTVIWLVWVYGRLYGSAAGDGVDHIARLLIGLLLLATAGWSLGHWPAQRAGALTALVLMVASLFVSLRIPSSDALQWNAFSQTALEQAHEAGRPVFVDFTAAWCLSCQVNERAVLRDKSVEHEFVAEHYVLLRADWTRYDPAITQELASVGRSGVPTYVVYPAAANSGAKVLPELLSRGVVLHALSHP